MTYWPQDLLLVLRKLKGKKKKKTKGEIRRKSVIKLRANISNFDIAKSTASILRFQSCFKV